MLLGMLLLVLLRVVGFLLMVGFLSLGMLDFMTSCLLMMLFLSVYCGLDMFMTRMLFSILLMSCLVLLCLLLFVVAFRCRILVMDLLLLVCFLFVIARVLLVLDCPMML